MLDMLIVEKMFFDQRSQYIPSRYLHFLSNVILLEIFFV